MQRSNPMIPKNQAIGSRKSGMCVYQKITFNVIRITATITASVAGR